MLRKPELDRAAAAIARLGRKFVCPGALAVSAAIARVDRDLSLFCDPGIAETTDVLPGKIENAQQEICSRVLSVD
jgi:hypothetical protein